MLENESSQALLGNPGALVVGIDPLENAGAKNSRITELLSSGLAGDTVRIEEKTSWIDGFEVRRQRHCHADKPVHHQVREVVFSKVRYTILGWKIIYSEK